MALPLEIQRKIYTFTERYDFDIRPHHLLVYINGDSEVKVSLGRVSRVWSACNELFEPQGLTKSAVMPFSTVSTSHVIRREAFEALLRNNTISLAGLDAILPVIESYVTSSYIDSGFFRNITAASIRISASIY